MRRMIVGLLKTTYQKSNADEVIDAEIEALLEQAEEIKDNADEVLSRFEEAAVA